MSRPEFTNEPIAGARGASPTAHSLAAALARARPAACRCDVPVIVGGDRREGDGIDLDRPGHPERVVAIAAAGTEAEVERGARSGAGRGRGLGRPRRAAERADVLVAAAAIMRKRRLELAALEVRDARSRGPRPTRDVCEAIDFLEYYARGAIELEEGRELLQAPGERNTMRYEPRGVAAVIAPWNFPLAIPAGMTVGGARRRQRVVLKPAEQSPGCALRAGRGAPRGRRADGRARRCCPASASVGRRAGRATRGVHVDRVHRLGARSASRSSERPPRRRDGQDHVKRVVAEMGGKNCVIVDADADLDEAVPAIVKLGVRLRRAEVLGLLAGPRCTRRSPTTSSSGCQARSTSCRWARPRRSATTSRR